MTQTISVNFVPSKALRCEAPVAMLAPDTLSADGTCSTLYLLHGMGGDHLSWPSNAQVAELVSGLPLCVVMPSAGSSFYLDSTIAAMESFVCNELTPYVDGLFPTNATASGRAITGLSMGGYGALVLALRRPDLFGSAASHSGAVLTSRATTEVGVKWDHADLLYGLGRDGEVKRREHDILELAHRRVRFDPDSGKTCYSGPALYLDCGVDDFLYYASREMTQAMRILRIPYEYHEWPGDHDWQYWRVHVADSLRFHLRHFARSNRQ